MYADLKRRDRPASASETTYPDRSYVYVIQGSSHLLSSISNSQHVDFWWAVNDTLAGGTTVDAANTEMRKRSISNK